MILPQHIRQVLAEMELLSYGAITAYNSSGGHGEPDRFPPGFNPSGDSLTGASRPLHDLYREAFEWAVGDPDATERLLVQAREDLARARKRGGDSTGVVTLSDRELLERRIAEEGKGWPASDVARSLRCSVLMVRRVRGRGGLDELGRRVIVDSEDERERARLYLARGLTERQVEQLTRLSRSSIRRLGKAA